MIDNNISRILKLRLIYVSVFSILNIFLHSQTFLSITSTHFNNPKTHDIYLNETIKYKCKGNFFYQKGRLVALSDSTLVFANNKEVKHSSLKAIRLDLNNHLVKSFGFVFIAGGIGFLPLNTLNNVIINDQTIFNPKAAYFAAGLVATGLLIKELSIKRIRITKKTNLKVLSINYQRLNEKDSIK